MWQPQVERNPKLLWSLVVVALTYNGLLYFLDTLTGIHRLDGSIGVILGLYICSRPAANAVDTIFFERGALRQIRSKWVGLGWLALNLLVLLVGWMVIVSGVMQLVD